MAHPTGNLKKKKKPEKEFVFQNYPSRKIALRLAYHGHVHDGLAKQKETDNTVEGIVCDALRRVRLVPEDGPHNFGRCGRTDKGVSALGNAFSFTARASCNSSDALQLPPLDYPNMLNAVLPPTIRIVGSAYVPDDFDARFSCVSRTYRYYFCHRGLDLDAMKAAAKHLLGTHNFRNFCKMDVVNVGNFVRTVHSVGIHESELLPELISYFEIKANSFLYHQIRCTMEVLFLVGRRLEDATVVSALLERGDRKPTYPLADGTPLILWDCFFSGVEWTISHRAFQSAERELQDISTALLIRACASNAMRSQLFAWYQGAVDPTVRDEKRESNATTVKKSAVVRRNPEDRSIDAWSITGCDWTESGTHNQLKARKRDLFSLLRHEDDHAHQRLIAGCEEDGIALRGSHETLTAYVPPHYAKLLDREVERTYEEEVRDLSDKKRARYEENESKKAAAALLP